MERSSLGPRDFASAEPAAGASSPEGVALAHPRARRPGGPRPGREDTGEAEFPRHAHSLGLGSQLVVKAELGALVLPG